MGDGEASGPPLEGGVAFENAAETTELGGVIKEETVGEMLGAESMPRYAMIACNAMSNSETERSDGIGVLDASDVYECLDGQDLDHLRRIQVNDQSLGGSLSAILMVM